jgi:hypothetical protein
VPRIILNRGALACFLWCMFLKWHVCILKNRAGTHAAVASNSSTWPRRNPKRSWAWRVPLRHRESAHAPRANTQPHENAPSFCHTLLSLSPIRGSDNGVASRLRQRILFVDTMSPSPLSCTGGCPASRACDQRRHSADGT